MTCYAYLDAMCAPCGPYDAHFVLLNVGQKTRERATGLLEAFRLPWCGESTVGFVAHAGEHELFYASLDHIYAFTPTVMAVAGSIISGNFRVGLSTANHRDYYDATTAIRLRPARLSAHELSEAVDNMPRSRVTQDHHLYVSRHELAAMYDGQLQHKHERQRAVEELLHSARRVDYYNQVSFITLAVYLLTAPLHGVRLVMKILNLSGSAEQFNLLLKLEGSAAKQNQTVFRDDLAAVFELQVLRNRVFNTVDWELEVAHRVQPQVVPFSTERIFQRATKIFQIARLEGARARNIAWADYWRNRVSAMPNGSIVSQYEEDRRIKQQLPLEGKVKSAWFASNPNNKHSYWTARQPEIYASTSTKYEWGKVRALYGCDVTSFLHADFAMKNVENTLPSYFPVGERANDKYVTTVLDRMNYGVPFCYDYDDFNSQHSISSMQAVIDAWGCVYGADLTQEQLDSLVWTKRSISNQKVYFSELRRTEEVHGTLLSGWRLTSFINTVLNRVYLEEAGLLENVDYAVHNGDDMYASCTTIQKAMNVVRRGKELGIRAQVAKTNIGTIGEFLRVDARARNPNGAQYLSRAIATAVHGRIEIGKANDARNAFSAVDTRAVAIARRGGMHSAIDSMLTAQKRFLKRHFKLSDAVVQAFYTFHPIQGGYCADGDVTGHKLITRTDTESHNTVDAVRARFTPVRKGVRDYVKHLCRVFKWTFHEGLVDEAFTRYADSLIRWVTSYEIVIDDEADYTAILRGLIGTYKDDPAVIDIAKSRQIGLGFLPAIANKTTPLTVAVGKAVRPYKYLAAVTGS